jgi:hypothetical protein
MLIPIFGLLFGAIIGGFQAKRRGGSTLDILQWASVYALILGTIALFIMIGIDRSYRP